MVNAQEWLDKDYPKEKRVEVKWLSISGYDWNNQEEKKDWNKLEGDLDLSDFINLEVLNCSFNQLNNLKVNNCLKLKEIDCSFNKLTNLDLVGLGELEGILCYDNYLSNLNSILNSKKLTYLSISNNNFPEQNLTVFTNFTNLKTLRIDGNKFCGSLENLKHFNELEKLYISDTDIDSGLEYLPKNLIEIYCYSEERPTSKVKNLEEQLKINPFFDFESGKYVKNWKDIHQDFTLELRKDWKKKGFSCVECEKWINIGLKPTDTSFVKWLRDTKKKNVELVLNGYQEELRKEHEDSLLKMVATTPRSIRRNQDKYEENYNLEEINYQEVVLRNNRSFSWENNQEQSLTHKNLPIKLYNIKEDKIEWVNSSFDNSNVKNYAILSYVWGQPSSNVWNSILSYVWGRPENVTNIEWNTRYKDKLSLSGYKALYKAIQTCKLLGINYLWMDQLCINQKSTKEKNREVPKMKQYYSNAAATLISINTNTTSEENKKEFAKETLKRIIKSAWFTRAWTYQEGWLSKQTLFMFDDKLVDGQVLSRVWVLLEQSGSHFSEGIDSAEYEEEFVNEKNINDESKIFATPIGWTRYGNEYNSENKVNLGLYNTLWLIRKERQKTVPIDGIYSILGLLPYGDKVKPEYKPRMCPKCPNGKEIEEGCNHEEKNKKWHVYTKKELEKALIDVMEVAIQEGYNSEILAWLGPRRSEPYLWWIPEMEKTGSADIWKAIEKEAFGLGNIKLNESDIMLTGSTLLINDLSQDFPIDVSSSKAEKLSYEVLKVNNDSFAMFVKKGTTKLVKMGDVLVIPEQQFKPTEEDLAKLKLLGFSAKNRLAILVPLKNALTRKDEINRPISMVMLQEKTLNFDEIEKKLLFISMVGKKIHRILNAQEWLDKKQEAKIEQVYAWNC